MGQKVWVIGDPELDVVPGKNKETGRDSGSGKKDSAILSQKPQKNPALSFSLSMLAWGGGYMHLGQWRLGLTFLAAMILFYSVITAAVFFWSSLSGFMAESFEFILGALIIFLSGLVAWMYSAVDAYYRAQRSRTEAFLGLEKIIWPVAASFLFPGWGQFLNSQPRKGMFFLFFGVGGVFSASALFLLWNVWPLLATTRDRNFFEACFLGFLVFVPLVFFMWIVSAYDAFRSCEFFLRYRQRSKLEGKRFRGRSFLTDLVPQCSAVLGLLLAVSLGMQFCPKQYYLETLKALRVEMLNSHMTTLPEWIQKTVEFLG